MSSHLPRVAQTAFPNSCFTSNDAEYLSVQISWPIAIYTGSGRFKFHIFASAVVLAGMAYWYFKTPSGRLVIDNILLKIPGIRSVIIQTNMALFSRTMSVLLNSGVTLPQIMEVTQQTTGNRVIRSAIRDVQEGIYEGQGLAKPMQKTKVFPSMMVRMVGAGELSGTLDSNLTKLANYYEDEANKKINKEQ